MIEISRGSDDIHYLDLVDPETFAAVTDLPPSTGFICEVWTPPGGPILSSPMVSWDDPAAGRVAINFTRAASAALKPGIYAIHVLANTGPTRQQVYRGTLRVLDAPNAPPADPDALQFCDPSDVYRVAPWSRHYPTEDVRAAISEGSERIKSYIVYLVGSRESLTPQYRSADPTVARLTPAVPSTRWVETAIDSGGLNLTRTVKRLTALASAVNLALNAIDRKGDGAAQRRAALENEYQASLIGVAFEVGGVTVGPDQ